MASLSGYGNELVEPPQKLQWKCLVCEQILREPHIASCCGLRYCRLCVERVQRQDDTCRSPDCRQKFAKIVPDPKLKRDLMAKPVYCINKNAGCQWAGELKNAEEHAEVECIWTKEPCPNQCGRHISRCRLDRHTSEKCPNRPRPCEFADMGCGTEVMTHNKLQVHMQKNAQRHLTLACKKLEEKERHEEQKIEEMTRSHQAIEKGLERRLKADEATIKQLIETIETHDARIQELEAMVPDVEARVAKLQVMVKERGVRLLWLLVALGLVMLTLWQALAAHL